MDGRAAVDRGDLQPARLRERLKFEQGAGFLAGLSLAVGVAVVRALEAQGFGPGLLSKVVGLTIVGFGGAPLYPLTVDRLYASAEHKIDSVSLGAICILASGTAVTLTVPTISGTHSAGTEQVGTTR